MKIHLLFYFVLSLVTAQAALTIFPNGPVNSYKAYLKGVCTAANIDCDLTPVSSCWNDASAAKGLDVIYQACVEVANSPPNQSSNVLKTYYIDDFDKHASSIADALNCEKNMLYARHFYEKLSAPRADLEGMITNIIHYASVRPDDTFNILRNMVTLAEQGNFEAVGLLDGNFMSRASALMIKENSDWRKNAKNGRRLLLKGMCESLDLDCPMDSLNCMNEQDSATNLYLLYEWFKSVAVKPIQTGAKSGIDFLRERRQEFIDRIPKESIEHDKNSVEVRLINEKLGYDVWSYEWVDVLVGFLTEFPEACWHYKVAEYQLFENNDLEGVGMVIGIAWYHVSAWKQGALGKEIPGTVDL